MTGKKHTNSKGGYLYVITHPKFAGYCKVGRTADLKSRLNVYNCSCPHRRFTYTYTRYFEDCHAAELKLRKRTLAAKLRGEWLRVHSDDARSLIQGIR